MDLKRIKQNYSRALKDVKRVSGVRGTDPDLKYYLSLSKESLDALREHYGDEQVEQYIQDMEERRSKGGK